MVLFAFAGACVAVLWVLGFIKKVFSSKRLTRRESRMVLSLNHYVKMH